MFRRKRLKSLLMYQYADRLVTTKLADKLKSLYGVDNVIVGADEIKDKNIIEYISQLDAVLIVIGESWNMRDWPNSEEHPDYIALKTAIENNIAIVPIYIDDARIKVELPADIEAFLGYRSIAFDTFSLGTQVDTLTDKLSSVIKRNKSSNDAAQSKVPIKRIEKNNDVSPLPETSFRDKHAEKSGTVELKKEFPSHLSSWSVTERRKFDKQEQKFQKQFEREQKEKQEKELTEVWMTIVTRRTLAFFIDMVIMLAFVFGLPLLIVGSETTISLFVILALLFLFQVIYHGLLVWMWKGQTLGKKLFGLRVIKTNPYPLTFLEAFLRSTLGYPLTLLSLSGGNKRLNSFGIALHDDLFHTRVVKLKKEQ